MRAVLSSHILSLGHDGSALIVEFADGSLVSYEGVPAPLFERIAGSPSPGRELRENVRGIYPFRYIRKAARF